MNDNALDHLGKGYFSGLPKLTTLYLDRNKIKQIHNEAFIGLEGNSFLSVPKDKIKVDIYCYLHFSQFGKLDPDGK